MARPLEQLVPAGSVKKGVAARSIHPLAAFHSIGMYTAHPLYRGKRTSPQRKRMSAVGPETVMLALVSVSDRQPRAPTKDKSGP